MQNVRNYTDKEILDRVKSLPSFKGIPKDYWLIGIRSLKDQFNTFDDKAYLFKGEKFIEGYKITTDAGSDLLNPSNRNGEAVLKSDGIYYNAWERRKHRGKVMAYCQRLALPLYRDKNKDRKIDEKGSVSMEIVGINIHPSSYQLTTTERTLIGAWSQGCQVFAKRSGANSFDSFMLKTTGQQILTYCLLKEFDPKTTKVASITNVPAAKLVESTPVKNEDKFLSDQEVETIIGSIGEKFVPSGQVISDFGNEADTDEFDNSLEVSSVELKQEHTGEGGEVVKQEITVKQPADQGLPSLSKYINEDNLNKVIGGGISQKVTKGGFKSMISTISGVLIMIFTIIGSALKETAEFIKENWIVVLSCLVLVSIMLFVYIYRQTILDKKRLEIGADQNKDNVY